MTGGNYMKFKFQYPFHWALAMLIHFFNALSMAVFTILWLS